MVYRRKRRTRRHSRKHTTKKQVHAIVKREVGKTRESHKLVNYVVWSSIPQLIDRIANSSTGLCFSLTGGVNPFQNTAQQPQNTTDSSLFVLKPSQYPDAIGGFSGVNQAGQGGMAIDANQSAIINDPIGGVYVLEGRQAYLKTWYAHIMLRNNPSSNEQGLAFVRMLVFETYRPLGDRSVAQQVLLQNHAVEAMVGSTTTAPESVIGYLNRENIKKVYTDQLIKLTLDQSSMQSTVRKLKIRINKKCRWSYYYGTQGPAAQGSKINYQGPFLYCLFFSNQDSQGVTMPEMCMDTMLTFYDD